MNNKPLSAQEIQDIQASQQDKPKRGPTPKPKTWTDEELKMAVAESRSMRACLQRLNLKATGGNYRSIYSHIDRLGIDKSHWTGQGWLAGQNVRTGPIRELDEILVENSTYKSTNSLKKRLLKEGLLEYKCAICGISGWNNKPLVLQLDHINGINNDHRLENLQLVCPNCDSQSETFRGRNKKLQRERAAEPILRQLGLIE